MKTGNGIIKLHTKFQHARFMQNNLNRCTMEVQPFIRSI